MSSTLNWLWTQLPQSFQKPALASGLALQLHQLERRLLFSAQPGPDALADHDQVVAHDGAQVPPVNPRVEMVAYDQSHDADATGTKELVIIDAAVDNYQRLIEDVEQQREEGSPIEYVLLNAHEDGISQVSRILANYDQLDAIHVVAHGSGDGFQVGKTWMTHHNLNAYAGMIAGWQDAISRDGDLLLYGCDLSSTEQGRTLLESLGALCDCDVAASDDPTGHETLGGDWDLEYGVGVIDTQISFTLHAQSTWEGLLAAPNSAPVLTGANNLTAIDEDPGSNGGTLVSDLISGWVTDGDAGALAGIAVIGVDNTNGTWEYSTDGGGTWQTFGTPSTLGARLVAADADNHVRFVPHANWNGTVGSGITFHAWDQTSGTDGGTADLSTSNHTVLDQFNSMAYTNNDGPDNWISGWTESSDDGSASTGNIRVESSKLHLDNLDGGDLESITRGFDASGATTASLSFDFDGYVFSGTDSFAIEVSDNGGGSWTQLEEIIYVDDPGTNLSGNRNFDLTSYVSLTADMVVHFKITSGFAGPSQHVSFDNVQVSYAIPAMGGQSAYSTASDAAGITINPVNDTPTVATNSGTTVLEGTTGTAITTAMLNEGDVDDDGAELTYMITNVTDNGTIYLAGFGALGLNDTFTQAEIDAGDVTYDHDGSETTSDAFRFSLADGGEDGSTPVGGTFNFTVTPVNDEEFLATNGLLTLNEGATADIDNTLLQTTDVDNTPVQIVYSVDSAPSNGTLSLNWIALSATDGFTQADIDAGLVRYRHDGGETTSDSFNFTVNDSAGTSTSATFNFTINPVNDAPVNMLSGQPQTVASPGVDGATDVYAADLDGDGDVDLVSTSWTDDRVTWFQNDGAGTFNEYTIDTGLTGARHVFAADINGDTLMDVLVSDYQGDTVTWYENDGMTTPSFAARTVTNTADGAWSSYAIDMDADGDVDVLSASIWDDKVAWYENDGAATPGWTEHVIATTADGVRTVVAGDLDKDGDIDVATASYLDDTIAWYESDGATTPGFTEHNVSTNTLGAMSVEIADVDADGNLDLVTASYADGKIAWFQNDGAVDPAFSERLISTSAAGARDVTTADMDGDGDLDILSASFVDDKFAWYENDGAALPSFTERLVSQDGDGPRAVAAADMDGDGDIDVVGASLNDDEVGFFENTDGQMGIQVTAEETPLTFNAANNNLVWISDSDASGLEMKVRLEITSGTISLSGTTGLTLDVGTGTSDAIVEFRGSAISINAAIDGMTFTPTTDFHGVAGIRILTDDQGNSGSGGALTDDDTINITVTPVNDEQVLATNTGTTVNEASTGNVLTTAMLETTDGDDAPGQLVYTVTGTTANGTLRLTGTALGVSDTFTQADLDAGQVTYDHNGSETLSDAFDFSVDDGAGTATSGTFNITVTPVNDEQALATNTGTTVTNGSSSHVLTIAMLETSDADNTPGELVYTVTAATGNGTLRLSGTALGVSDTFTQADINAGLVTYDHNGSDTVSDGFDFSVDDGVGITTNGTFNITVTPVNDEQVLATCTGTTVNEASTGNVLTTAMLETTDVDHTPVQLVYTVTAATGNGTLRLSGTALGVSNTFTQADIDGGLVTYDHDSSETVSDSFDFGVDDGQGTTTSGTFSITVTPVNDEQMLAANTGATVNEASTGNVLTSAMLQTTDVDNTPTQLIYTVTSATGNGTLRLSGTALGVSDTFTQADIDAGLVTYDHDGSTTTIDAFNFTVDDGQGTASTGTFNFTVTPVNNAPILDLDADDSAGLPGADYATTYNEDAAPVSVVDADATLTDTDNSTLNSVLVTLTNLIDVGAETLAADTSGTSVVASYNAITGVLTLSGLDSVSNYEQVLRTVTYTNNAQLPTTTDRTITFAAHDGAAASNLATTTVQVVSANDAPTLTFPPTATVDEDSSLIFSIASGNSIMIGDVDAAGNLMELTLAVANGTLSLSGATGLSFSVGDGIADTAMTFRGTLADINAALDGLQFDPIANFNGVVNLNLMASDLGNVGIGGPQLVRNSLAITVNQVNDAPVATDNDYALAEDTTLTGNLILDDSGLGMDGDFDGDAITATTLTQPANGSVTVNADGSFAYTPNANFFGTDSFTYELSDGTASVTANVSLNVSAVNDAPVGAPDSFAVGNQQALVLSTTQLLLNDFDIEGDGLSLTIATAPSHGNLVQSAGAVMIYVPDQAFLGTDSFTYRLSDGTHSTLVEVTITVSPAPFVDSGGNQPGSYTETANSTEEDDVILLTAPLVSVRDIVAGDTTPTVTTNRVRAVPDHAGLQEQLIVTLSEVETDDLFVRQQARIVDIAVAVEDVNAVGPRRAGFKMPVLMLDTGKLWNGFDQFQEQLMQDVAAQQLFVKAAQVLSTGISAGYIIWTLRGSYLVAFLSAALPSWVDFDPIPVLDAKSWKQLRWNQNHEFQGESLQDLAASGLTG